MADGSLSSLALVAETGSYGATPATPAFATVRKTTCNLVVSKDTLESEENRGDRQITDLRHGNRKVGGDIGVELSYGSFDTILQALLMGTWTPKASKTANTISAAAADNSYNDSGAGFAGFEVNDKVGVLGFTGSAANNITSGKLTAVAAGKLTVGGADGDVIVDDAAGEAVTIATRECRLKAGSTRRSFTLEEHFADLVEASKPYHRFTGCEFDKLTFTVNTNAMVKGSLTVVGKDMAPAGTVIADSTYAAAATTSPFDAFTGELKEGGATLAIATEIQLTIENGLSPDFVLFDDTCLQPSPGKCKITGQLTAWFTDASLLEKFLNETESSLQFTLTDGAGNSLTFLLPRIKYTGGGGVDVKNAGRLPIVLPFTALYDTTNASNIVITRVPA